MPIFEYKCPVCHHTQERIVNQGIDSEGVLCDKCGAETDKIDISRTSFRLMPGGAGGFHAPSRG